MTPERWRQIGDLFDAAVRLEPAQREAWLRRRLRRGRRPAGRGQPPPDPGRAGGRGRVPDAARVGGRVSGSDGELGPRATISVPRAGPSLSTTPRPSRSTTPAAFPPRRRSPRALDRSPSSETVSVVRERLLELPIIYILILAMTLFWTHVVLGDDALTIPVVSMNAIVIVALGGIIALLSSRWPVSLNGSSLLNWE